MGQGTEVKSTITAAVGDPERTRVVRVCLQLDRDNLVENGLKVLTYGEPGRHGQWAKMRR